MHFAPSDRGRELCAPGGPGAGWLGLPAVPIEGGHVRFILRRFVVFVAAFLGLLVYRSLYPLPFAPPASGDSEEDVLVRGSGAGEKA